MQTVRRNDLEVTMKPVTRVVSTADSTEVALAAMDETERDFVPTVNAVDDCRGRRVK